MSQTAVVILNWNGRHWLEQFLPKVIERSPNARVIIADNGSSDDSESWTRTHAPQAEWLPLGDNHGYAEGYNRALQTLDGVDYAVLMNSDIEPLDGWLEPLVQRFDAEPQLGAIQPKIKDHKRPSHFEYAGAAGGYLDVLGYPFAAGRVFDHCEEDLGQYNQGDPTQPVFWASGACLMVRLSAYWQAGGLDPKFFAHMEEIDLCWRMQMHGFLVEAHGQSEVLHVGGGTLNALSPRKTFLNFRNSLLILVKNLPAWRAFPIILTRLILDGLAGVQFMFQGKPQHTWAIVRAHFAFYGMMTSFAIRPRAKKGWPQHGLYRGSIVWWRFARGRKVAPKV